ncbi:pyridoxal phosphate-dependent aminotransferase [Hirschia maritima]|uniref:pyridoxal phosphate-dependent aminotransferase n=1 Tax=Hirschia maritima TaxID=1121961 RepID=UPI00036CF5A8|nr:histidinol-phosphate transaminase [Hirschia maritima]
MAFDISRRFMLTGAVGTGFATAACATNGASTVAEEAAFPPEAVSFDPYLLGPKKGVALLSRNENPYGPSKSALKMIEYAAKKGAYYASREAVTTLMSMIAERNGVEPEQVVITTGSGEALSAIALIYGPKGPIVAPRLFWDTTALYAAKLGMATIERIPLTAEMEIDLAGIEAKVSDKTGLVQLCNPNNPTGVVTPGETIRASVKRMAAKTTVLVDEAYIELADDPEGTSCISLLKEGHDVIISRTFSKIYGMAGIRVGYTISSAETAEKIRNTAMSWSPGTSYAGAIGAYNDFAFLEYSKNKVVEGREMVLETLNVLGLTALPSGTNFVYFKSGKEANVVQKAMMDKNISVRGQYMDYSEWTRVSMGKIEDVARFCKALPEVLGA